MDTPQIMMPTLTRPVDKQGFLPPWNFIPKNKGQSLIEFILSFTIVLFLIFFIFQIGVSFTNGYLVHYATFMASRTYLVIDNNSNSPSGSDSRARNRGSSVFEKFPMRHIVKDWNSVFKVNHPGSVPNPLFTGGWTEYSTQFGISELIGGKSQMILRSESFLGREPTRSGCLARICRAMEEIGGDCTVHTTFFDNGC
jgi:hypothetical protein